MLIFFVPIRSVDCEPLSRSFLLPIRENLPSVLLCFFDGILKLFTGGLTFDDKEHLLRIASLIHTNIRPTTFTIVTQLPDFFKFYIFRFITFLQQTIHALKDYHIFFMGIIYQSIAVASTHIRRKFKALFRKIDGHTRIANIITIEMVFLGIYILRPILCESKRKQNLFEIVDCYHCFFCFVNITLRHTKSADFSLYILVYSGLDSHYLQYTQKSPRQSVSVSRYFRKDSSSCREMNRFRQ